MKKVMTVQSVARIAPREKRFEVSDALVPGLRLVVYPNNHKSFIVRYRRDDDKKTQVKLTLKGVTSLAEARDRARSALGSVAVGQEPAQHSDDVEAVFERYLTDCKRRLKTWRQIEAALRRDVLPLWRGRRIQSIDRRDVIQAVDDVSERAPIMGNRTLSYTKAFFGWAHSKAIIDVNPTSGLKMPRVEQSRDRVLSLPEVKAILAATNQMGYPFAPLIRILFLTGQRVGEVAGMRWSEVEGDTWSLPPSRVKNSRGHTVPLTPAALSVLEAMPRFAGSEFVFTTTGRTHVSGFSNAKEKIDKLVGFSNWRLHDARRTVATNLARLGVSLPAVERLLNHTSGSFAGVAGVYSRFSYADEIRSGLLKWSAEVGT